MFNFSNFSFDSLQDIVNYFIWLHSSLNTHLALFRTVLVSFVLSPLVINNLIKIMCSFDNSKITGNDLITEMKCDSTVRNNHILLKLIK